MFRRGSVIRGEIADVAFLRGEWFSSVRVAEGLGAAGVTASSPRIACVATVDDGGRLGPRHDNTSRATPITTVLPKTASDHRRGRIVGNLPSDSIACIAFGESSGTGGSSGNTLVMLDRIALKRSGSFCRSRRRFSTMARGELSDVSSARWSADKVMH